MAPEEKQKLKEIFDQFDKAAIDSWNERKRLIEKKYKNEGEKEREIQADTYYRAWSQMSNAIRDKFPELWSEFNS
jgi:predicted S18 family serine protease